LQKIGLKKKVLTYENLYKLILIVFGFVFLPGIIFLIEYISKPPAITIPAFYSNFYRLLLDTGKDGLFAWCIVSAPYMVYEVYLLIKKLLKRTE
jgi:hypothetical protein